MYQHVLRRDDMWESLGNRLDPANWHHGASRSAGLGAGICKRKYRTLPN